jgi:hypothetical protein
LLADKDAVALASAASLVAAGRTGNSEAAWGKCGLANFGCGIAENAVGLRSGAKAKNLDKFSELADELNVNCEACYAKYRPEILF